MTRTGRRCPRWERGIRGGPQFARQHTPRDPHAPRDPRQRGYHAVPLPAMSSAPSGLPRRIGLWSAMAVVVGSTIGSGIFRSPAGIADRIPGPLPLLIIWVLGGAF